MSHVQGSGVLGAVMEGLEGRVFLSGDGTLDGTFANGTTFVGGGGRDFATSIAPLKDGGFLVAGFSWGEIQDGFGVVRYRADGSVNPGFGTDGQTFIPFDQSRDCQVAVQADGKVVVAGQSGNQIGVARLLASGVLDDSFGDHGKVLVDLTAGEDVPHAVAVRPDGRIVVAATASDRPGLFQLTAAGALDSNFGMGGKVVLDRAYDLADIKLTGDGRIVGVGGGYIMRLNANGSPDATFESNGFYWTPTQFTGLEIQSDGSLLTCGWSEHFIQILRFYPNDHTGRGFGGAAVLPADARISTARVVVQRDGKIVVSASVTQHSDRRNRDIASFTAARFNADGSQDRTFGTNGLARISVSRGENVVGGIALLVRGRLVLAGRTDWTLGTLNFHTVAFTRAGQLDTTFGNQGQVDTDVISPAQSAGDSVVALPNGDLLMLASTYRGYDYPRSLRVFRYHPDGTLDETFNGGQALNIDFGVQYADPGQILLTPDATKFIVVGTANPDPINLPVKGAIAMYNLDGTPVKSFGSNGLVLFAPTAGWWGLNSAIFQGDKLLVLGNTDFTLMRFNLDGSLDTTFGEQGISQTRFDLEFPYPIRYIQPTAMGFDPSGRIVVGGTDVYMFSEGYDFAMAMIRLTADGKLDTTFGDGGKWGGLAAPNHLGIGGAFAFLDDGKIIAFNAARPGIALSGEPPVVGRRQIVRFNADGSIDTTFGSSGFVNLPVGAIDSSVSDVLVQADGKVVLVGGSGGARVVRLMANGRVDPTFVQGIGDLGASGSPGGATMLSDGRIVVAGNLNDQPALARFNNSFLKPTARLVDGVLTVTGTDGKETLLVSRAVSGEIRVSGMEQTFAYGQVRRVVIKGLAGNDTLGWSAVAGAPAWGIPITVEGGDGADTIVGGPGDDVLMGGLGDDSIVGNAGNDTIFAHLGNDTIRGGDGNDYLNPGPGMDAVFGDGGNDQIVCNDGQADTVDGGAGFDRVKSDVLDRVVATEGVLG